MILIGDATFRQDRLTLLQDPLQERIGGRKKKKEKKNVQ